MSSIWWQSLAVGLGGACGTLARFGVNRWFDQRPLAVALQRHDIPSLMFATLTVNVLGCLLAGLCLVWIEQRVDAAFWRTMLITGVLGGLTTFSALGLELFALARADRWTLLGATVLTHVGLGLAAVALGWRLGQLVWARG